MAFLFLTYVVFAQKPKVIGDCTLTYTVKIAGETGESIKRLYIKGSKTRTEIESPSFFQTTIYNSKTGEAVILKMLEGEKYISKFDADMWKKKNKQWEEMTVKLTDETKMILGYPCKKAVATTKAGRDLVMYYTTGLVPSASENPFQFKSVAGLVMEYESETNDGKRIVFKATHIDFSPVPAAKFEIPVKGYRVL